VPGSMPPKPSTSNSGQSWAVRHRGPRGRVCRLFSRARGPRERSPWTCEPRPWHFRLSFGLRRAKSRFRGRKARSGEDLVMSRARLVKCPGRPNRPHWIPPPTGPMASWGRQHRVASMGLGGYLRRMRVWGPLAGHAQAEEACRVVEKATRFMFRYRLKVDWGPGEASNCVDVASFKARDCVLARISSLHALKPSPCTCPPILETNRVNKVSIV
jgi:hypothetical protein